MFQVIECDEPLEIREGETEEDWILSQTLIERVKIDLPQGCVEATKQKPQIGMEFPFCGFCLQVDMEI